MSELGDFLTPTLTRQLEAEKALINGDPGPRLAMWSTQDPVTVSGAEKTVIGSEEARQVFRWLATRFSNLTDYRFELVAAGASGDLAYTVGYEHITVSMVVIVAGYRLADLTRPADGGSGVRRVGVMLGLEGHHGGRVDLAAGKNNFG
jgi:hypothetical protein